MLPIQLKVEVTGTVPTGDAFTQGMRRGVYRASNTVRNQAMLNLSGRVLKRRTGRLANLPEVMLWTQGDTIFGMVGTNVKYGKWQEFGIPHPWIIRAHGDGMLHFNIGGVDIFRKQVRHPGLKPRPWLRPALLSVAPTFKAIMTEEIAKSMAGKGSG
jgi:hypothetical protein